MLARLQTNSRCYPRQFWISLSGSLLSSTGGAMVLPFLTIYLRRTLNVPLATVASLLTISSISYEATFCTATAAFALFGLLILVAINAIMCILAQYSVTQIVKKLRQMIILGIGALFYAGRVGSVTLGASFWAFAASMAVMTLGELKMTPIATTMAANLAPVEARGRYMSVFGLTWPSREFSARQLPADS